LAEAISNKKLGIAYGVFWLFWFELHLFVLHHLGFTWQVAAADSIVNNTLLAVACFGIGSVLRWYTPDKKTGYKILIWLFILAGTCAKFTNIILLYIFNEDINYTSIINKTVLIRFGIALLIITWTAALRWIFNMIKQQKENEDRKTHAENLVREAELTGLRQQLQPHFLFNSLNSISALAGSKPEEARKMIQQLSDFLRGTLKKDDKQMLSLQEELKHLQLYLDIEKVRFGHRLNTEIKADEQSLALLIPPLLLQPLVENAIKFGLYDTIGEVTIQINASIENKNLVVTITNPFDAETAQPNKGTGFGLKSVQRRLHLLFFRNDLLSKQNLYTTTVIIPQTI
jgi:two-component system LytT family sensor kinase